jgi:hypothetical protein
MTRVFTSADESWADDQIFGPASPPYSAGVLGSERVLEASSTSPTPTGNSDLPSTPTDTFLYESSLVSVDLGRRIWGLRQPVYGHNDLVQGTVKLHGKCTHVYRLEVSVKKCFLKISTRSTADQCALSIAPWKSRGDNV